MSQIDAPQAQPPADRRQLRFSPLQVLAICALVASVTLASMPLLSSYLDRSGVSGNASKSTNLTSPSSSGRLRLIPSDVSMNLTGSLDCYVNVDFGAESAIGQTAVVGNFNSTNGATVYVLTGVQFSEYSSAESNCPGDLNSSSNQSGDSSPSSYLYSTGFEHAGVVNATLGQITSRSTSTWVLAIVFDVAGESTEVTWVAPLTLAWGSSV